MDGIIFLEIIVPFIVQPLSGFRVLVSGTTAAAVLAKAGFDEFLVFLRCMGIAEMGVDRQAAFRAFIQKVLVNLVLRDEHFALPQETGLSIKVPFLVWQVVEDDADAVGVIR